MASFNTNIELAWVVVQVTATAVPALNMPEWVNTVVFFIAVLGFPLALFFAWAFEITPDGIKKESEIAPDGSIRVFLRSGISSCCTGKDPIDYSNDLFSVVIHLKYSTEPFSSYSAIEE
jgi:hypothetical protein